MCRFDAVSRHGNDWRMNTELPDWVSCAVCVGQMPYGSICPQGNNPNAIKYLKQVLEISAQMKEYTGDADAYGSIADIYADMGEFEKAATFYDSYINKMQEDGQAV